MEFSQLLTGIQENFSVRRRMGSFRRGLQEASREQRQRITRVRRSLGTLSREQRDRIVNAYVFQRLTSLRLRQQQEPCARRHLPVGQGPHSVGIMDLMSDVSKSGTFIRLFYPSQQTDIYRRESQWPLWLPRKQYGHGYVYFRRKNTKVFGTILNWFGGDVYVPALWQGPVQTSHGKLPVIVFSHGLGGNRTTYTTLCSHLASHGFVVAAIEHRDGTASMTYCLSDVNDNDITSSPDSDGEFSFFHHATGFQEHWLWYERQEKEDDYHIRNKQVHTRVKELQKVLDILYALNGGKVVKNVLDSNLKFDLQQFKKLLDLEKLAVAGHSFGAATAVATLAADQRFRTGVSLDGWMHPLEAELYSKVKQPVLMVNTEVFQWESNVQDMLKLKPNQDDSLSRVLITLRGTCHQSQTDFQFMVPAAMGRVMALRSTLEPLRAMDLATSATKGFLAHHMGIPNTDTHMDILTATHDDVILGTNLPLSDNVIMSA